MAEEIGIHSPSLTAHLEACRLHGGKTAMCSGIMKRKGGYCINKAIQPLSPGTMPTCRIHRDRPKPSTWCRVSLPCGFDCGRICEWRPHEFQLCSEHDKNPMPCYFLKIPIDVRLNIYGFLLPHQPIPARNATSRWLIKTEVRMNVTILRANRQIHDEAARLLYTARTFNIELAADGFVMCHSLKQVPQPNNHALQDYQIQLMLLEDQNRRRLTMARQEQGNITNIASLISNQRPPSSSYPLPIGSSVVPYTYGPVGPAWCPPLSANYFNMIRSFVVEVVFPPAGDPNRPRPRMTRKDETEALESKLYEYCDYLHRLVGRLGLMQVPIMKLKVVIKLENTKMRREEAISTAQVLLRPFQRLRNVGNPELPLILTGDLEHSEVEPLDLCERTSVMLDQNFRDYLGCWLSDVSSSEPWLSSPVFDTYWQLERLLFFIVNHHSDSTFAQFTKMLHTAKVAREADDLPSFKAVWDTVVVIWLDYVKEQERLRADVMLSMNAIGSSLKEAA